MADTPVDTVMLTTNSKILVTVDEALQDIIVVSYAFESKLFQGVLLDSTKRFLPCRISNTENVVNQLSSPKTTSELSEEDKLFFSIRQRFTYFQEKPAVHLNHLHHLHKKLSSKAKTQKMTVRLRPRQVLCSKCKSICNENSENVTSTHSVTTRGTKKSTVVEMNGPSKPFSENRSGNQVKSPPKLCPSFIPRLPRMKSPEVNGNALPEEEFWYKDAEGRGIDDEDDEERQMVLRKKRSVGSMEDLWDETVFEEGSKKARTTTPVIKISFGSQGEGTVLKIPSKVRTDETDDQDTKAAKKAMKKAKKEARRNRSPNKGRDSSPTQDTLQYRKHRHKVKHKKKHKVERSSEEDMKERCLKQKLSINLKRLTSTSMAIQEDDEDEFEDETRQEEEEESSQESSSLVGDVPDFPAAPAEDCVPPSCHFSCSHEREVTSCRTGDGATVQVGDIVWGKIHGFPWWPGKILNILIRRERNGWDAHVSWFGSSTCSLMPCDQLSPFLQAFKVRYNRRKKSAGYKEAIRQATSEASASSANLPVPEGMEIVATSPPGLLEQPVELAATPI
uniref:PWWP domain-containing protein n=1 Tax=Triatoma infestans TaxID=30076 RepID=A0A023F9N4_TRIIF